MTVSEHINQTMSYLYIRYALDFQLSEPITIPFLFEVGSFCKYKMSKGSRDHLMKCRKSARQSLTPFHNKNSQQTRNRRELLQLEKGTANIRLNDKRRRFSPSIRKKKGMFALATSILYWRL